MTAAATMTVGRLLPICILAALLTAAAAARAETVEQLYEVAKAEKSLVFYAGGPTSPYEARIKEFQEKFPGIEVSVSGGFRNVLNQRIEQQLGSGKLEVDLAFFQTVQDFISWKKRGRLLAFKPDGFDQIMPGLRDPDGTYMAFAAVAIAYAYNTNLVRAEDVPKSALDFLKPAFHGKLISVYPHDDDAALSVPSDCAEIRLELDGRLYSQQTAIHSGPSPGCARHCRGQNGRHPRRDDHDRR
jgi:hypothetical protein